MSSLWTPEGEHRVAREQEVASPGAATSRAPTPGGDNSVGDNAAPGPGGDGRVGLADELAQLEQQLMSAPAADVVANHCYGLFQLAALHLGAQPPHLDDARLAIDALAAVVDGLGPRLGPAAQSLTDGLAQIRLAYVQIAGAATATRATAAEATLADTPPIEVENRAE